MKILKNVRQYQVLILHFFIKEKEKENLLMLVMWVGLMLMKGKQECYPNNKPQ